MEIQKRCLWCGKQYIAHKMTTKYCSHQCNSAAYKDAKRNERLIEMERNDNLKPIIEVKKFSDKPYLSPSEVGILLGLSRASVYRYMASGDLNALQLKGKTRIRRSDVEKMFENSSEYSKRGHTVSAAITNYTLDEISEKYNIDRRTIQRKCEEFGIKKVFVGPKIYYDKELVDEKYAELLQPIDTSLYYTADEMSEKFGISYTAVIAFVNRHGFPKIKRHKNVYYSKYAVDEYVENKEKVDPDYYTYDEISAKYGFNKINISYYVNQYKVETLKKGRRNFVSRESFDRAILEHKDGVSQASSAITTIKSQIFKEIDENEIPDGYCDADQIASEYGLRRPTVWRLTRENNIPKISISGINYYETASVMVFFSKYKNTEEVTEWISAGEVESLFGLKGDARRHFASRHNIHSKVVFGKAYYSKEHIENAKNNKFNNSENYYSIPEAMEKYKVKREVVYAAIRYNKVKKYRLGKQVYVLKEDFDNLMNNKKQ